MSCFSSTPRWLLPVVPALALLLASCGADSNGSNATTDLAFATMPVVTPASLGTNEDITLTCTITNLGLQVSSGSSSCPYRIQRDGVDGYATGTIPGIAAGATITLPIVFRETVAGTHTYNVVLNAGNVIGENNYANNQNAVTVSVADQMDLALADGAALTPASPTTASTLTFTFGITNRSSAVSATHVRFQISRDGTVWYSGTAPVIAPGATWSYPFTIAPETVPGAHTYDLTIDPDRLFHDPDRTNNGATFPVTVLPGGVS